MIYNFLLLLGTFFVLPKWLVQKKYRGSLLFRLGLRMPKASTKKTSIWIHMVSMGETRAMIPIYQKLREDFPDASFHLSSTTKTGHNEAKRALPNADNYFYLPLDFSWTMKRLAKLLKPNLLLLSESDFWYHMIKSVKEQNGHVFLLNGKISEKSTSRFAKIPSQKLFSQIDHFLVQNATYASRFNSLKIPPEKITITGNLKLAVPTPKLEPDQIAHYQRLFHLDPSDTVITVGSTHEHEEELIIPHIPSRYKILLAARHPERFFSLKHRYATNPQVTVVDKMGILPTLFQLSDLAIIGGSFLPGIGGHNIFEPIQAKIPVLFGPFMDEQQELVELILGAKAGIQTPAETLTQNIERAFALKANAEELSTQGNNILESTYKALELNSLLS